MSKFGARRKDTEWIAWLMQAWLTGWTRTSTYERCCPRAGDGKHRRNSDRPDRRRCAGRERDSGE